MAERGGAARQIELLHCGWTLLGTLPGAFAGPSELPEVGWGPAVVPGTVAQALRLDLDRPPDLEAEDWWYRCTLPAGPSGGDMAVLCLDGLATLAEVFLNGERLLVSRSMFRRHRLRVELRGDDALAICFRALRPELERRRPRPRWKAALVEEGNVRWLRTTLLGRIPGWTPRLPPVGPYRSIRLERWDAVALRRLELSPRLDGDLGRVGLSAELRPLEGVTVTAARLSVGEWDFPLALVPGEDEAGAPVLGVQAEVYLQDPPRWWPHGHGAQPLLPTALHLETSVGERVIDCGPVGFRSVSLDREGGRVSLRVNGRAIFCRGACWTVEDARSLDGPPGAITATLRRAREGGLNMLRIGGTMVYGSDELYQAADALGVLVWQDLSFANLDYPFADPDFCREATEEVEEQLRRLRRHPSLAVWCGNSEIQQQVAMLGLPRELWADPFFTEAVPDLVRALHPGAAYFPSTPCEGALPFHTATGLTHYYGVGAYRRPLSDVRAARVRFSPECLGFSNVPDQLALERLSGGALPLPHQPAWKAGVPRDAGAGWDFEDVRDHYLQSLFGVDPVALRSVDPERYFALSRAVTGELMLRVFAEWRRPAGPRGDGGSGCGGALVWFLKDLRPGAGWGILDDQGRPKAAYWYLRRAWAGRAVLMTEEGQDGVDLHVHNEHPEPLVATVELELLRGGRQRVGWAAHPVTLEPWGALTLQGDALLPSFSDLALAYRFGPPGHDVVVARLVGEGGALLHEDAVFPGGHTLRPVEVGALRAHVAPAADGALWLHLRAEAFLQTVTITSPGWEVEEDCLHLSPGRERALRLTALPVAAGARARPFKAEVSALNLEGSLTVRGPAA
jgi:beta-mannosidase